MPLIHSEARKEAISGPDVRRGRFGELGCRRDSPVHAGSVGGWAGGTHANQRIAWARSARYPAGQVPRAVSHRPNARPILSRALADCTLTCSYAEWAAAAWAAAASAPGWRIRESELEQFLKERER